MDLTQLPLLEAMRSRMSFLSARQTVLAENVANANTPEYRARDIEEPDFAAMAAGETNGGGLAVTDPGHITTASQGFGGFKAKDMPDSEATPNGNSVVLEEQMMKLSSVQMDYSTVTQLYRKALSMIRLAAGASR
jgi:flagellar basal-body rod protein FlgB